ncbi:MAG: hypothetical protein QOI02_1605 [Actinomycetota bacterium]|nr:hypothetical protein [Actinomycetota bacterium]
MQAGPVRGLSAAFFALVLCTAGAVATPPGNVAADSTATAHSATAFAAVAPPMASASAAPANGTATTGDELPGPSGTSPRPAGRSSLGIDATGAGIGIGIGGGTQRIYISVANVTKSTSDNTYATVSQTQATTLASELNSYWSRQTDGAVSVVLGGVEQRSLGMSSCSATAVLDAEKKVAFSGKFANDNWGGTGDHLIVITQEKCAQQSFGTVGGDGGTIISNFGTSAANGLPFLAHEFGHNLGFRHANATLCRNTSTYDAPQSSITFDSTTCPTTAYDDYLDVMGYSVKSALPHVSSPQLIELGYLQAYRTLTSLSGALGPVTLTLSPLAGTSGVRAAKIIDPRSGDAYYVEYRTDAGEDATSAEFSSVRACHSILDGYKRCNLDSSPTYGTVRILRTIPYDNGTVATTTLAVGTISGSTNKKYRHPSMAVGQVFTSYSGGFTLKLNSRSPAKGASITVTFKSLL